MVILNALVWLTVVVKRLVESLDLMKDFHLFIQYLWNVAVAI